ncbi:MAG: WG repeat-containing protein, partial [Anaerolineales bacterium]|nr:WG repeat-containing protein [Anaerolineales bacterium]
PKRFWTEKSGLIGYANDSGDDCTRPPYGLMNYAGQPVGAQEYGDLRLDHLGVCYMIPAYRNKLWGFIDGAGQEVIPFRYHGAWNLSQPFQNGKWYGGVNLDGKSWKVDMSGSFVSDKF